MSMLQKDAFYDFSHGNHFLDSSAINAFILCTSVLAMNTTLAVQILSFAWARRCKDLS